VRPTFDGAGFAIESHLLDGLPSIELTESTPIEVCFLMRLRDEQRFPSAALLKAQILQDVGRAQTYFRRAGSLPTDH
jgi:riboflavin kinase/FMN adenylyltransferase